MFPLQTKQAENKGFNTHIYIPNPISTIRISINDITSFEKYVSSYSISACILSSTSVIPNWIKEVINKTVHVDYHVFNSSTPSPIKNKYHTPSTLGADRLASAICGYYIADKKRPVLCIDCGTAITYDFVNAKGEYLGGNISPGLDMRFKSLHDYTSKLPLVDKLGNTPDIGYSTTTAIRSGVKIGIKKEITGYIKEYQKKYPNIFIFFTGGNTIDFDYPAKKCIFAEKNLVLKGLYIVLDYLLSQK